MLVLIDPQNIKGFGLFGRDDIQSIIIIFSAAGSPLLCGTTTLKRVYTFDEQSVYAHFSVFFILCGFQCSGCTLSGRKTWGCVVYTDLYYCTCVLCYYYEASAVQRLCNNLEKAHCVTPKKILNLDLSTVIHQSCHCHYYY